MNYTIHELYAERNARQLLLQQSTEAAIAHLEHVVGAFLLAMQAQDSANVHQKLDSIEQLDDELESIVQLYGENSPDITIKSKREKWRDDLAEIEAQIAELEAARDIDEL